MIDDVIDYRSYFPDILRTVKEGNNIKMCLLKKTSSKKNEKKRTILDVEVDEEVPDEFRKNITQIYSMIVDNKELKCDDFFTGEKVEKTMFVIDEDNMISVGTLNPIISQIIKDDDSISHYVSEFDKNTLDKLQSYAILISFLHNEKGVSIEDTCICFRKYHKGTKISKNEGTILWRNSKNGKFTKVDGDVFKFDNLIDATYYERRYLNNPNTKGTKIMFVWDVKNFEEMFSFDDFYIQHANEVYNILCAYGNIEVDKKFYDGFTSKKSNLKSICALNKKKTFSDIDFETFIQIHENALSKDCDFSLAINEGKIKIENEKAFNEFTHLCLRQIVGDLADENIIYFGNVKQMPTKVKQKSS